MSRPSGLDRVWLPVQLSDQNVLTSAELVEGPTADRVILYVLGDATANFTVPAGLGARVLIEFGLARALERASDMGDGHASSSSQEMR